MRVKYSDSKKGPCAKQELQDQDTLVLQTHSVIRQGRSRAPTVVYDDDGISTNAETSGEFFIMHATTHPPTVYAADASAGAIYSHYD